MGSECYSLKGRGSRVRYLFDLGCSKTHCNDRLAQIEKQNLHKDVGDALAKSL